MREWMRNREDRKADVCTREGDHVCRHNGPCNGLPRDRQNFHADNLAKIDPHKLDGAVTFLRSKLRRDMDVLRKLIADDPQNWWAPHHFFFMMSVRNLLRGNGYGEKDLGIDNLDDYAVGMVELAALRNL